MSTYADDSKKFLPRKSKEAGDFERSSSSSGRRRVLRLRGGGGASRPVLQVLAAVVAVVALVGDDEHRRLAGVALHVLPRRAPAHRAALVVPAARKKLKFIKWSVPR